jgi:hypothetical protein
MPTFTADENASFPWLVECLLLANIGGEGEVDDNIFVGAAGAELFCAAFLARISE